MKKTPEQIKLITQLLSKEFKSVKKLNEVVYETNDIEALLKICNNNKYNRKKDNAHANELTDSIVNDNEFNSIITLVVMPSLKNIKIYELRSGDGHHRVWGVEGAYSRKVKVSVMFKVEVVNSIEEFITLYAKLNSMQMHLKSADYIAMWVLAGIPDYADVYDFVNDEKRKKRLTAKGIALSYETAYKIAAGGSYNKKDFKEGKYKITNKNWERDIERLFEMQCIIGSDKSRIVTKKVGGKNVIMNLAGQAKPSRSMFKAILHPDYKHDFAKKILPTFSASLDLSSDAKLYGTLSKKLKLKKYARVKKSKTPLKKQASKQKLIKGFEIVRKLQVHSVKRKAA